MADLKDAADAATQALQDHLHALFHDGIGNFKVVVECDGGPQSFMVLEALLRKRSDVFAAMLSHDFIETQEKSITLTGFSLTEVRAFFEFLYTGKSDLTCKTVVGLGLLSDKYNVPSLQHLCATWMDSNLTCDTVGQMYMSSLRHADSGHVQSQDVQEVCLQFIDRNASKALPHLHALPDSVLDAILAREGLCILEHQLIDGLVTWVEQGKKSADAILPLLSKHARLVDVSLDQFAALQPRLKKARLEAWGNQASHAPGRSVFVPAVLASLSTEYQQAQLGSKPFLGYWVAVIPSRANLLECGECYHALMKGTHHHQIPMQKGDYLSFLIPHRRVRPQSFSIKFPEPGQLDKPMTISASIDGNNWTELVRDTEKCASREVHGYTLRVDCRCNGEFKWFKFEAQDSASLLSFDIQGIVLPS